MDDTSAKAQISFMAAATADPPLADGDLDELVKLSRVPDLLGRKYGEDGYEPTYELYSVVATAWLIKAGRVAGNIDLSGSGGAGLKLSQQHAQCLKMAEYYNNMANNTPPQHQVATWPTWVGNLNG